MGTKEEKKLIVAARDMDSIMSQVDPTPSLLNDDAQVEDCVSDVTFGDSDISVVFDLVDKYKLDRFPVSRKAILETQWENMEIITRKEFGSFMRPPIPGSQQRHCVRGSACEGLKMLVPPQVPPFVLVEYLPTKQRKRPPAEPQLCVLCIRALTNYFIFVARSEHGRTTAVFHSFANVANMHGEYRLEDCLVAGTMETHGFVVPIVHHVRGRYGYVPADPTSTEPLLRVPHFDERGYGLPLPDFQLAAAGQYHHQPMRKQLMQ